jgi:hypothetical protein
LETELCHAIGEWDILCEGFIMTFNFEIGFDCINQAPQEFKEAIFRIPQVPLDLIQPDWTTRLSDTLECYNGTAEEEDEDPKNINIPEG